jgi:16S rRNA (guanine527-N7)-methyltransferase
MFHGKHAEERLDRAASWASIQLDTREYQALAAFSEWLGAEAVEAGGVGPMEAPRIIDRHVADSLVFAGAWGDVPDRALDVGAGVGLPGIPLAITHPQTKFTLLDRSERRCRLARRAVRILGLQNVSVEQRDIQLEAGTWPAILFRASLPPDQALAVAAPLLDVGGSAVVGLSRTAEPTRLPQAPPGTETDLVHIGIGVLDSPAWLLRMRKTEPRTKDGNLS